MFDIHTSILDSEADGELDEERLYSYIDALMTEFDESPEAEEFRQEFEVPIQWSAAYMEFAGEYFGVTPATIRPQESAEILFDLFPRKHSVEAEAASEIIFELRAFWQFLKRTRSLASVDAMLEMLEDDDAERLEAELADPENFGMAKSFVMAGMDAGFDMTDQDDVQRFMLAYNTALLGSFEPVEKEVEETEAPPVATFRNDAPRIGRNSPCPCGSGRKYKKCCLR